MIRVGRRIAFDNAIRLTGAKLVLVESPEAIAKAANEKTAMIYTTHIGESLERELSMAHDVGVPLLLDDAAGIPPTPARATIRVSSLPDGVQAAFTGIAVRDLSRRRAVRPRNMAPSATASPCVFASDTLYCSAKSGFIPGPNGGVYATDVAHQTRQTMRNLLDNLVSR